MNARERVKAALSHQQPDRIPVDFGSTAVTGIHVQIVEKLRDYFGLDKKPVKVIEPYQMLGEIEEDLVKALEIDTVQVPGRKNMFGIVQDGWREFRTFWGQVVLVPGEFNTRLDENGDLLLYPEGDLSVPPSGKMPKASFFFDAIIRQVPIDDKNLRVEDNLEEFTEMSDDDIKYWRQKVEKAYATGRAVVAGFGGTAIGDIALVPAVNLKHPKGIRDVTEWYMSTVMRQDYLHGIFERQTDIAISNMKKIFAEVGNKIDVVFLCGTDFGTQDTQFCDQGTFRSLYFPYYRKMNDWIHEHTEWRVFKHSCGAVEPLMQQFIDAGFDIINPVQISAAGMDPGYLKKTYGGHLTFWGGGVDTQKVLSFGSPEDVRNQVKENCRIFGEDGGFVFNTVHNIQANTPVKNVIAMLEAIRQA
jgi:uroporphyrinogen-III decarboxylase